MVVTTSGLGPDGERSDERKSREAAGKKIFADLDDGVRSGRGFSALGTVRL